MEADMPRIRPRRVRPRARTYSARTTTDFQLARIKAVTELLRLDAVAAGPAEVEVARPKTRGDCSGGPRPCPWVSCRAHLYLDVNPETGSVKLNFPDVDPTDLIETCSLDVADRGSATLEEVGLLMNVTRERVRQIETRAAMHAREEMFVTGAMDAEESETRKRDSVLVQIRRTKRETAFASGERDD